MERAIRDLEEAETPLQPYQWQVWEELRRAERAVAEAFRDLEQPAAEAVRGAQELAAADGVAAAARMGRVAGAVQWAEPRLQAIEALSGFMADGSPLVNHFATIGPDAVEAIRSAVAAGIAAGDSAAEIAGRIRGACEMSLTRAETIARTETIRAFREATRQSYEANADVLSGWVRVCAGDSRVCAACWALHGTRNSVQTPCASHPRCFVAGTMVSTPEVQAVSDRWYSGEVVDIRIEAGDIITVTPNHPILTPDGWVAAGQLKEGGYVIRAKDSKRMLSIINPDNDYIPTAIEKIAESFTASHGVTPRTVETSAVDFHGDGAGSDIAVIWADSLLRDAFETPALEPLGKESFRGRPRGTVSLTGRSDFASVFDGLLFPSDCLMCGGSVGDSLFDGSASGESAVRVGIAPEFNPGLYEPAVNDGSLQSHGFGNDVLGLTEFVSRNDGFAVNFEPSGPGDARGGNLPPDGLVAASQLRRAYAERLAGEIETNRIVGVERRAFAGHVYNLQTTTGWYIANNIISHNCRCVMVPEVVGVPTEVPGADELFGRMSAEQQREALGPGRYEAWRGGAALSSFGRIVDSPRWGPVAEVVPLAEVT